MSEQKVVSSKDSTGTEGGRRPTGVPVKATVTTPDPEVIARTSRRRLTIAYKLKVLDTVATLRSQGQGAIGAYLRKEGLYYSNVHTWEQQRAKGCLTIARKGPKEKSRDTWVSTGLIW